MGNHAVLLVDDDPDILDSLKTVLEMSLEGVDVRTAPSGPLALDALGDGDGVGLIISDFRMPGMDGAEFLSRAHVVAPGARRMLISAFPEALLREQARLDGVERVMPKPMDIDEFIAATRSLLKA